MKVTNKILLFLFLPLIGSSQVSHYSKLDGQVFNNSIEKNSSYEISINDSTISILESAGDSLQLEFRIIKKYEIEGQVHFIVENEKNTTSLDHTFDVRIENNKIGIESLDIDQPQYYNFSN